MPKHSNNNINKKQIRLCRFTKQQMKDIMMLFKNVTVMIKKLIKLKLRDHINTDFMILNGHMLQMIKLKNMFMDGQLNLWIQRFKL